MHAFASYVREDDAAVSYAVAVLRKNGIKVWFDKDSIAPGTRWHDAIVSAIREGQFFVAFFSRNWNNKPRTVANEEVLFAVEELRLRPRNRAWFIPVRLDACEIPDIPIGAGETLRALQYIDFSSLGWREGLRRLLGGLGVADPVLAVGEPLGAGLSPLVELSGGELVYERFQPTLPGLAGLVFPVAGGTCMRNDKGQLVAFIKTRAPVSHLQSINEMLGFDSFYAVSTDPFVSGDPARPTRFAYSRNYVLPRGASLYNIATGQTQVVPTDLPVDLSFVALGALVSNMFRGSFQATMKFGAPPQTFDVAMQGSFEIGFRSAT